MIRAMEGNISNDFLSKSSDSLSDLSLSEADWDLRRPTQKCIARLVFTLARLHA